METMAEGGQKRKRTSIASNDKSIPVAKAPRVILPQSYGLGSIYSGATNYGSNVTQYGPVAFKHPHDSTRPASTPEGLNPSHPEIERSSRFIFNGEDKEDYPKLQPDMITFQHGDRVFPTVLLDHNLSKTLQQASLAEQELRQVEETARVQKRMMKDYQEWAMGTQDKLLQLYEAHEGVENGEDIRRRITARLRPIQDRRMDIFQNEIAIRARVHEARTRAIMAQSAAAEAMEEVFVRCRLMQVASEEKTAEEVEFERKYTIPEDFDLNIADSKPASGMGDQKHPPANVISQAEESPEEVLMDPKIVEEVETKADYDQAVRKHENAARQFEQHQDGRSFDIAVRKDNQNASTYGLDKLQQGRKLTRALIEAEEKLSLVKQRAKGLGLATGSEASVTSEQANDAVAKVDYEALIHRPIIQKWIDDLPEQDMSKAADDGDDDEQNKALLEEGGKEFVQVWESKSMVAEPSCGGKEIRQWQAECEALRDSEE